MGICSHFCRLADIASRSKRIGLRAALRTASNLSRYDSCCLVTQWNDDTRPYSLGNHCETTFEEIWNRDEYRQLREQMTHPTAISPLCEGYRMVNKPDLVQFSGVSQEA